MNIIGLRAFADNYIWVLRHEGYAVVTDPGDAVPVIDHLRGSGDKLSAILITHHHHDHVGGLDELTRRFDVPVFGPAKENIPGITHPLHGGEKIEVPGINMDFDVLDVGGHTRGHIAYYRPKTLLCGDTLFVLGCGRLFEGTPAQMTASLERIAVLPRDTLVYCGHEYAHYNLPFAFAVEPKNALLQERAITLQKSIAAQQPTVPMLLGDELDTNPFLRCGSDAVIAAASTFRGYMETSHVETLAADNTVAVFAAIREWRNNF